MAKQSEKSAEKLPFYIPSSKKEMITVTVIGLITGLAVVLFSELLARFLIDPIFCRSADNFSVCANGGNVAFYTSTIVISMISVAFLVRFGIFRPLLIALGAAAILWGIRTYLSGLNFVEYLGWVALLYGLSFAFLFWVLRIRNFVFALIAALVFVVLARMLLIS